MDNLFREGFAYRGEPGWHKLGTQMKEGETCVQGLRRAKGNFRVFLAPLTVEIPTKLGTQLIPYPLKSAIVREPVKDDDDYRVFGYVSPDYKLIQNVDIAKTMDLLTDKWPCETVGVLGKGETVFIMLDAGEIEINKELVHLYFGATDTKDGGTSLKIAFTPVRWVCQNTLISGLKSAVVTVTMEHVGGIEQALASRVQLIKQLESAKDNTLEAFNVLAKCTLKPKEIEFILNATYPMPKRPKKAEMLDDLEDMDPTLIAGIYEESTAVNSLWQYYCERQTRFQDLARDLFARVSDQSPTVGNTAWALYNAVVESADYRDGAESANVSAIWGTRSYEKRRAFSAAMTVAVSRK